MKSNLNHILWINSIFFFLPISIINAQVFKGEAPGAFVLHIQNIPAHGADIEVDSEGNIYLLDSKANKIYRYLSIANYDSALSIGGAGNRENGFLEIRKISLPNRQQLYVLDVSLQEVVILNPDLKIVRRLSFWNQNDFLSSSPPIQARNFTVGHSGDVIILNDFDNKVYIYNVFGELIQSLGGNDYGTGNLNNPKELWTSKDNLIYVLEEKGAIIKVFDNQGTYQTSINLPGEGWNRVILEELFLISISNSRLMFFHINNGSQLEFELQADQHILDVQLTKEFIYLLCESGIYIYTRN